MRPGDPLIPAHTRPGHWPLTQSPAEQPRWGLWSGLETLRLGSSTSGPRANRVARRSRRGCLRVSQTEDPDSAVLEVDAGRKFADQIVVLRQSRFDLIEKPGHGGKAVFRELLGEHHTLRPPLQQNVQVELAVQNVKR